MTVRHCGGRLRGSQVPLPPPFSFSFRHRQKKSHVIQNAPFNSFVVLRRKFQGAHNSLIFPSRRQKRFSIVCLGSLAHLIGGLLGAVPVDRHLFELFPLVGAAEEHKVGVEALEDGARPLPLQEDGILVAAGEVGDDGGRGAVDVRHQLERL